MSSIKVHATGAVHMVGKADKGKGDPYDFSNIAYLINARSMSNSYMRRRSIGKEETTIAISDDFRDTVLDNLEKITFPCDLELELAPDPRDVSNNVVVGFKVVEKSLEKPDPLKKFGV